MRARFAHELKPLKTARRPNYFLFVDTETRVMAEGAQWDKLTAGLFDSDFVPARDGSAAYQNQVFRLGWCCYLRLRRDRTTQTELWHYFDTLESFWQFAEDHFPKRATIWIIAHNIKFDWWVLEGFARMAVLGFDRPFCHFSQHTNLIKYRKEHTNIFVLDSTNWFPFALAVLGEWVGLKKLDCDPFDLDTAKVKTYCHRDVEILKAAVLKYMEFIDDNGLGPVAMTIASQALKSFRYTSYKGGIFLHNTDHVIDLERAAYKGGRNECFRIGKIPDTPVYALDVNSMYPAVMRNYPVPTKLIYNTINPEIGLMRACLRYYSIIAHVEFEIDHPAIAVKDEYLIFPTGTIDTVLTTPELLYILKFGKVLKIHKMAVYEHEKIFTDYVDLMYRLRLYAKRNDDKVSVELCKKLLNALYGKFGQRCDTWSVIDRADPYDLNVERVLDFDTQRWNMYRTFGGLVEEKGQPEEPAIGSVAIAAHVTAYARQVLTDYIIKAGWENCFYCDTDSIFTNGTGYQRLWPDIDSHRLGALKLEGTSDDVEIFSPKDYRFGNKTRIKGITPAAQKIDDHTYVVTEWPGFAGLLAKGQTGVYTLTKRVKRLRRTYHKGIVGADGRVGAYHYLSDGLRVEEL